MIEEIIWIDAKQKLPDADCEVLVKVQRNDGDKQRTEIAVYDDSDGQSRWWVDGDLYILDGNVLFWAEVPSGPKENGVMPC
jgi:hypothetical protein